MDLHHHGALKHRGARERGWRTDSDFPGVA